MVPERGLEPPLPCENQLLKLARLPIPPLGHECDTTRHFSFCPPHVGLSNCREFLAASTGFRGESRGCRARPSGFCPVRIFDHGRSRLRHPENGFLLDFSYFKTNRHSPVLGAKVASSVAKKVRQLRFEGKRHY